MHCTGKITFENVLISITGYLFSDPRFHFLHFLIKLQNVFCIFQAFASTNGGIMQGIPLFHQSLGSPFNFCRVLMSFTQQFFTFLELSLQYM